MGFVQVYSNVEKNRLARPPKVGRTVQVSEHQENLAFQQWGEYWKEDSGISLYCLSNTSESRGGVKSETWFN